MIRRSVLSRGPASLLGSACAVVAAAAGMMTLAPEASAQTMTTVRVASGLARPIYVTAPEGDFSRLFVVEQRTRASTTLPWTGRIRIMSLPGNVIQSPAYLEITPVGGDSEQGLLGLAFHPDFANNGFFYTNHTNTSNAQVITRWRATGGNPAAATADPASGQVIWIIPRPATNHNGGWIGFDPTGMLIVSMGDSGGGGDPSNLAQNLNSNLGKILRIDVDGADNIPGNADDDGFPADANRNYTIPSSNPYFGPIAGNDEIFAEGLRNPWRTSIDRGTGDMWIGDVGQSAREEVNVIRAGTSGQNFGWRCYEGNATFNTTGCLPASNYVFPVVDYLWGGTFGHCSVIGGYVYRGCAIPSANGLYFMADYCSGRIWTFPANTTGTPTLTDRTTELAPTGGFFINNPTSFGEDARGELYITDQTGGEIFRITPRTFTDCNSNGQPDTCDLATGVARDVNRDGVLDSCRCVDDWDGNGEVEPIDIAAFFAAYRNGDADADGNGETEPLDISVFFNLYRNGCI